MTEVALQNRTTHMTVDTETAHKFIDAFRAYHNQREHETVNLNADNQLIDRGVQDPLLQLFKEEFPDLYEEIDPIHISISARPVHCSRSLEYELHITHNLSDELLMKVQELI